MLRLFISGIPVTIFLAFLFLASTRPKHRKGYLLGAVVASVLGVSFAFFPIENAIISFPTPESVAQYACQGKVIDIVEGKDSGFILYSSGDDGVGNMITPKTGAGYKVALSTNAVGQGLLLDVLGYSADVYSGNVGDYYVLVQGSRKGHYTSVSDNLGTNFTMSIETKYVSGDEYTNILAYAYLSDFSDGYEIIFMGENALEKMSIVRQG